MMHYLPTYLYKLPSQMTQIYRTRILNSMKIHTDDESEVGIIITRNGV